MRTRAYPINVDLKCALKNLFDDVSIGLSALGVPMNVAGEIFERARPPDLSANYEIRVSAVRKELEEHVVFLATQVEEFDNNEDTARIRGEAVATLMALRALHEYLPECFT